MPWHLYVGLAVALFCVLPTQLNALIARSTGCHHNGTWYADKSVVPTVAKCLNCQCNKKTLVCRLKVCPEMPMPPPRGCVVVQQKNTCCPYLSCARLDAFYNIPTTRRIIAYLDHYERESIDRVVNENVLQRRSDDSEPDLYVCVKNGTVYKSGSAMSSSNLCTYCYCIGGSEKCVKPKCMLPVEGCKPIFVDSTCCPVRYDCSTKTSGKSSQEVRYRKTSNKHFLRTSQRLQRNRGCTLNGQYYAEGQKMKSDLDKPCDICFCIRGSRRCAPKKCSPALKNCMPVVPKGQCCPSSYDCGSQRDYRRAQSSRQFNLFSLLFGNQDGDNETSTETGAQYPLDRHPTAEMNATTDRTLYDTLREGLEFIDGNNNQMLADNLDLLAMQRPQSTKGTTPLEMSKPTPSTEVSFLDLLLAPNEPVAAGDSSDVKIQAPPEDSNLGADNELSWVDLLLGPEEEEGVTSSGTTISDKLNEDTGSTTQSIEFPATSIDRLGEGSDEAFGSGEVGVWLDDKENRTTSMEATDENYLEETTTEKPINQSNSLSLREDVNSKIASNITKTPTVSNIGISTTTKSVTSPPKETNELKVEEFKKEPSPNKTSEEQDHKHSLLGALLGGISDILNAENKSNLTQRITDANQNNNKTQRPTNKPMPMFKPLPGSKPHMRINSKIANYTSNSAFLKPEINTFKPLPNSKGKERPTSVPSTTTKTPTTTTQTSTVKTSTTMRTTTIKIPPLELAKPKPELTTTTTVKTVVINTNPTILEAEPLDSSAEPTLPPSLPNLKIIPFLPTDAVELDRPNPLYDFYNSNPQTSKMDYDLYDEVNMYPLPSITERYPTYADLEDASKAEYIYKFNVEGPVAPVAATIDKMDVPVAPAAFLKYDFTSGAGFSPPTETEGGFVPKDPLIIDETAETNDQVTKHIIDITTSEPMRDNTTKPIDFTTPDPFRDVIHTEPPPDLSSLIEDKEKVLKSSNQSNKDHTEKAKTNSSAPVASITVSEVSVNNLRDSESIDAKTTTSTVVPPFKILPLTTIQLEVATSTTKPSTTTAKATVNTTTIAAKTHRNQSQTKGTANRRYPPQPTTMATAAAITKTPPPTTRRTKPKQQSTRRPTRRPSSSKSPTSLKTTLKPTASHKNSHYTDSTITSTITVPSSTSMHASTESTTKHPFHMSPFDKLPFMNASFDVKRQPSATPPKSSTSSASLLGLVHYKNSINKFEGLEPAYQQQSSQAATATATAAATSTVMSTAPSYTLGISTATGSLPLANVQHAPSNSLIDPAGILKLAGCNIYGRMYRVGRIILELSSACVECKCTEVGVKCGPLDC